MKKYNMKQLLRFCGPLLPWSIKLLSPVDTTSNLASCCRFLIKSKYYFSIFIIGLVNFEKNEKAFYTPDSLFTNMKSDAKFTFHAKKSRKYEQQYIFSNNDVYLQSDWFRNLLYADRLTKECFMALSDFFLH